MARLNKREFDLRMKKSENRKEVKIEQEETKRSKSKDKISLIIESLNISKAVVDSFKEYRLSQQQTIRHKIDSDVKLKALDNELNIALKNLENEKYNNENDFKLKYKSLENEEKRNELTAMIIMRYIDYLDKQKEWIEQYGNSDKAIDDIKDKYHQAMMKLPEFLPSGK